MNEQLKPLKIAKEFPYNKIGGFRNANPFTIAFVYPQSGEACVVKGGLNDVKKYIDANYPIAIINYTFFAKGKHRGYYRVNGEKKGYHISFKKSRPSYRKEGGMWGHPAKQGHRCMVIVFGMGGNCFEKEVRRLPRCWMKELDPYVGA